MQTVSLTLLVLLQAAQVAPIEFDLKTTAISLKERDCRATRTDEIVVCASRTAHGRYRLKPADPAFEDAPLTAETKLFGSVDAGAHVESKQMQSGVVSNRVMVTLKMPF